MSWTFAAGAAGDHGGVRGGLPGGSYAAASRSDISRAAAPQPLCARDGLPHGGRALCPGRRAAAGRVLRRCRLPAAGRPQRELEPGARPAFDSNQNHNLSQVTGTALCTDDPGAALGIHGADVLVRWIRCMCSLESHHLLPQVCAAWVGLSHLALCLQFLTVCLAQPLSWHSGLTTELVTGTRPGSPLMGVISARARSDDSHGGF